VINSLIGMNVQAEEAKDDVLIIINKSNNKLAYYVNGEVVKIFPVATGRKSSYTPEGSFKIVNKIKNRPYYKEKIPGGDPRNPLGDRWLGLDAKGTYGTTYAIHGNNNSKSIGKYVSAGCIRMYNDDVRWLFDELSLNTKVIITTSELSFDQIAEKNQYLLAYKELKGSLFIDGEQQSLNNSPIIYRGRTLIPLRVIFEKLGAVVEWQPETQAIKATKQNTTITHQLYSNKASINDQQIQLDSTTKLINGMTYIPLRFVSESFGALVEWSQETQSIFITTKK
jgi:hypothetical protein